MKEATGFTCDHCTRAKKRKYIYVNKYNCKRHESKCYHNPENKACATCKLWVYDNGYYGCEDGHEEEGFFPTTDCEHWSKVGEP